MAGTLLSYLDSPGLVFLFKTIPESSFTHCLSPSPFLQEDTDIGGGSPPQSITTLASCFQTFSLQYYEKDVSVVRRQYTVWYFAMAA